MSDDFTSTINTTGSLTVGGSITGNIETNYDRDWFAINLNADQIVLIDLEGSETGQGTLANPFLTGVYDSNGVYQYGTNDYYSGVGYNAQQAFVASNSGTYYISASSLYSYSNGYTGTYTLSTTEILDDFESTVNTTGSISIGGSSTGSIDYEGDRDWFEISLNAGQSIRISIEGSDTNQGTLANPNFSVIDSNGVYQSGTGNNSASEFFASSSGTYYISASSAYLYSNGNTGTYTLSTTLITDDFDRTVNTTGSITVGGSSTGSIDFERDIDWFEISLNAGQAIIIDLEGSDTGNGTLANPYISAVYDSNGSYLSGTSDNNSGTGNNAQVTFVADSSDVYYISSSSGYSYSNDNTGTYTLSATLIADDFENTVNTTGSISAGGSSTGSIDFDGDRDWFEISLNAGQIILIDLEGSGTSQGTLSNPYLAGVYDSDGIYQYGSSGYSSGTGNSAQELFTANSSGTYYISAGSSYSYSIGGTGTYTLSTTLFTDDFGNSVNTTGNIIVDGSSTGSIDFDDDTDWFEISLNAGQTILIDLEGSETSQGTLYNPYLGGVYDSNGDYQSGTSDFNSGTGNNAQELFTASSSGTYYISAGASDSYTYGQTGTYTLSTTLLTDDFTSSIDTTGRISVGGSSTGSNDFEGDTDWFEISLNAGQTILIDLEGSATSQGTLTNPYLRGVYDSNGSYQSFTTDYSSGTGYNSQVAFTADNSGDYYISAGSSYSYSNGESGTYTLSTTLLTDDFTSNVDTTGSLSVGGTSTGEIEFLRDNDWFEINLNAGETVVFDLEGSDSSKGTLEDPYLSGIYDSSGNYLSNSSDYSSGIGDNSQVALEVTDSGIYYVSVEPQRTYSGIGTYSLSATSIVDDFSSSTDTTGSLVVGGTSTGSLEYSDDRDWFKVNLVAGEEVVFNLEGSSSNLGSLDSARISGIYNSVGDYLSGTYDYSVSEGENSQVVYTASSTGDYYVSADSRQSSYGAYSSFGTYTLSASLIADDYSSSTDTLGSLTTDTSVVGDIEVRGDTDWFKINLIEGQTIRIDLEGSSTSLGTLDNPYINGVYDSNGTYQYSSDDYSSGTGDNAQTLFTADSSADYYIATSSTYSGFGSYTLSATLVTDDLSSTIETTGSLTLGGSSTGEIEIYDDTDWFAINLTEGETVVFNLEGSVANQGTLDNVRLQGIYNSSGNYQSSTRDYSSYSSGLSSQIIYTAGSSGEYFVSAGPSSSSSSSSNIGTYTISASVLEDDFTESIDTEGSLTLGSSSTGEIEFYGDKDWFEISLTAGQSISINLEGSPTNQGTLGIPQIHGVYDSDGNYIYGTSDYFNSGDSISETIFTADTSGLYYISADSRNYTYSSTIVGTYTLSAALLADDFSSSINTTGSLSVGSSVTGDIEFENDRDWFEITLTEGQAVSLSLEGSDANQGTLDSPLISGLYDSSGDSLDYYSFNSYSSETTLIASTAGSYYVSAGSGLIDYNTSAQGTYTLSATLIDDDFSSSINTTGSVSVGGSVTGDIEFEGDTDWFEITLAEGQVVSLSIEGSDTNQGTLDLPSIRGIYDSSGDSLYYTSFYRSSSDTVFTATTAGSYYVEAGAAYSYYTSSGYYSGTGTVNTAYSNNIATEGTYTLSASVPADDFESTIATVGALTVGSNSTGEIEFSNDTDWFKVALTAGQAVTFDLEGSATNQGTLRDTYLRGIYDSSGTLISGTTNDDGGTGLNSQVTFTASSSDNYYVSAGAYSSNYSGTYSLSATAIVDDFSASSATTGSLNVGSSVSGEIEFSDDIDWFSVSLTEGQTITFDLEGASSSQGSLSNPSINGIYDSDGQILNGAYQTFNGIGNNDQVTFTASSAGTYYVSAGSNYSTLGTYSLSATTLVDDYSSSITTSGSLSIGGSSSGNIEVVGDTDWFEINLLAGDTVVIDLEGSNTFQGTLSDTYLRGIYDSSGTLISGTTNDDGGVGLNSQVTFSATDTGSYYISAGAYSIYSDIGTYTISVTEGEVSPEIISSSTDDYNASISTSGTLSVGGNTTGNIEVGNDTDWFSISLTAGETIVFDLEGSPTSLGTLGDTYLRGIHDSSGTLITGTTNDDGGTGYNSQVTFTASATDTFYVSAGSYSSYTGTYTLSATVQGNTPSTQSSITDDFGSTTSTTGTLSLNASSSGNIETIGDTDWFEIALTSGQTVVIDLEGSPTGQGTIRDTYIRGIYDSSGALISDSSNDDSGVGLNSQVTYTATANDNYYVAAGAYSTSTGTYTLSATEEGSSSSTVTDDFSATISTTASLIVGGNSTGNIESSEDTDWFKVNLTAGQTVVFDLEGSSTTQGTLSDTYLRGIYDSSGNLIDNSSDDDSGIGLNAQLAFTAITSGDYFVSSGAFGSNTGTYNLSATALVDDFGANINTVGSLTVGGSSTGNIEISEDSDWFKINLTAGQTVVFDLEGSPTNQGTLDDTYINGIYDSSGNLLSGSSNDDSGTGRNSQVTFTATTAGDYFVSAGAFSAGVGTYTLTATQQTVSSRPIDSSEDVFSATISDQSQRLLDERNVNSSIVSSNFGVITDNNSLLNASDPVDILGNQSGLHFTSLNSQKDLELERRDIDVVAG